MLPSPAQGAIAVVCRKEAKEVAQLFAALHHDPTAQCVEVENRDFLRTVAWRMLGTHQCLGSTGE